MNAHDLGHVIGRMLHPNATATVTHQDTLGIILDVTYTYSHTPHRSVGRTLIICERNLGTASAAALNMIGKHFRCALNDEHLAELARADDVTHQRGKWWNG